MKKLSIALALALIIVLALASVASADNGPHGGFNGSTNACSSCHRVHSAVSTDGMLLVQANIWLLCTSCHNGTGAFTNVVDGYYDTQVGTAAKSGTWAPMAASSTNGQWGDAGVGLFGGGFVNARMLTNFGNGSNEGIAGNMGRAEPSTSAAGLNNSISSWAEFNAYDPNQAAAVNRPVTSRHDVYGATANPNLAAGTGTGTIWGSGNYQLSAVSPFGAGAFPYNTTAGTPPVTTSHRLECTSCHNPHGNAGENAAGQPYPSYRLLDFTPGGSNGFEVATQTGTTGYWDTNMPYSVTDPNYVGVYALPAAVAPNAAGVLVPDTPVTWYSVNNVLANDGMLAAYRGRSGSGEVMVANFAGQGDYMGRYYGYMRPAGAVTTATTGSILSCGATPTVPGTACAGTNGDNFNNVPAHDALGYWCSTCHDRYMAPGSGSRTLDSTDPGYHYRHRAAGNSNSGFGTGQYTCVDCHNAHGTAALADTQSAGASYATGSVLLKADNRAVCIRCHAGAVNFFNVVTSPSAPMILVP